MYLNISRLFRLVGLNVHTDNATSIVYTSLAVVPQIVKITEVLTFLFCFDMPWHEVAFFICKTSWDAILALSNPTNVLIFVLQLPCPQKINSLDAHKDIASFRESWDNQICIVPNMYEFHPTIDTPAHTQSSWYLERARGLRGPGRMTWTKWYLQSLRRKSRATSSTDSTKEMLMTTTCGCSCPLLQTLLR